MHGNHQSDSEFSEYSIMEEANEDSQRYVPLLQAGAHKVVHIRAKDGYLQKAFEEFAQNMIMDNHWCAKVVGT